MRLIVLLNIARIKNWHAQNEKYISSEPHRKIRERPKICQRLLHVDWLLVTPQIACWREADGRSKNGHTNLEARIGGFETDLSKI
jgi:hypothetical protein